MSTPVVIPEPLEQSASPCLHCGNPALVGQFCCMGCETVFAILQQSGLSQYYKRKAEGFQLKRAAPVEIPAAHYENWNNVCGERPELYVDGVHCSACVWLIEKLPEVLPEVVVSARLDLSKSTVKIQLRPEGKISEIAERLASWGYRPELLKSEGEAERFQNDENRRRLIDLGIAGALAGNVMLMSIPLYSGVGGSFERVFEWISAALSVVSLVYCGRSLFANVLHAFRSRRFSIDLPIVLALVAAFLFSGFNLLHGVHSLYYDSMTALIFLLLASRYALARLRQLGLGQSAFRSWILKDSVLRVGDFLTLSDPKEMDVDVRLVEGRGFVSQAFLTGESAPMLVVAGDMIYAGSRWLGSESSASASRVEVVATGPDTRLAKILRDQEAISNRGRSNFERVNETRAFWLVSIVLVVALGVLAYFGFKGEWESGLVRAISLLIVTCPCAFALAAPLTLSLGMKRALEQGAVVRDPDFFERFLQVRDVFLDKTGTLTTGHLQVEVNAVPGAFHPIVRALTARSSHPVSRAISRHLGVGPIAAIEQFQEIPGFGVQGRIDGQFYGLFRGADASASLTTVDFLRDDEWVGLYRFSDEVRGEARDLVSRFQSRGFRVHLLSGDQRAAVQNIADLLGIPPSQAHARLSPEEKSRLIESSQASSQSNLTLMVGDGLNDALALKTADVSIAVRGGLENSLRVADVYTLNPGLHSILALDEWALRVRRVLGYNFLFSTAYNVFSGALAVAGLMSPLLAAVLMPLSAVTAFTATLIGFRRSQEERWK